MNALALLLIKLNDFSWIKTWLAYLRIILINNEVKFRAQETKIKAVLMTVRFDIKEIKQYNI